MCVAAIIVDHAHDVYRLGADRKAESWSTGREWLLSLNLTRSEPALSPTVRDNAVNLNLAGKRVWRMSFTESGKSGLDATRGATA